MKSLYPLICLLLFSCAESEIPMKETPLRLTGIKKFENMNGDDLTLQWESLDGNIRIVSTAPVKDSDQYRIGTVYARCFIQR